MPETLPAHLDATRTGRGFAHLPQIEADHFDHVRVYESPSAEGPHVWLAVSVDGEQAIAHLTAESAWHLAEQLMFIVKNHYQGDATPADTIGSLDV